MKKRLLILGLFSGMVICTASYLFVMTTHFNPITGIYAYDPRTDQPSSFFLENRPDVILMDYLTKRIENNRVAQPTGDARLVRAEPVNVEISTYTDWQAYAYVMTRLDYSDGTSKLEEFRFNSSSSEGTWLPLVGSVTFRTYWRYPL